MSERQNPWERAAQAAMRDAERPAEPETPAPVTTPEPVTPEQVAAAPVAPEPDPQARVRGGRFHSSLRARRAPAPEAARNPLLPPAETEAVEDVDHDDDLSPVMVSGPAEPTGAPAPLDPLLEVPPPSFTTGERGDGLVVQVCGLHGGAGTSTVASLLGEGAHDCGTGLAGVVDQGTPVVFVARTHAQGLLLVRRLAAQWASGGLDAIEVLGVVLVDDAPALSRGLQREVKSAERALPHAWRLGWSEDFRHDPELPGEASRGRLRRMRKSLLDKAANAAAHRHSRGADAARATPTTFLEKGSA